MEQEDKKEHDEEDSDESEFSDSDEEQGDSETGLTQNQNRLLYLVSLYTHAAQNADEQEEWVRQPALLVLAYEAIVAQVLDYDYAPASQLVENCRKYINISQEAKSDIDFLREEELLNGLKLSSNTYQPVTCYQVSEKGSLVLKKVSKSDREAVHEFVYAPKTRDLLRVEWNIEEREYWLVSDTFSKKSTVTECEDVSYVSSAYVPQCLRRGGRPTLSNAHRAHECNQSDSNIRDELDEVITLNSVSVIVAEFIPFGANQIVQLNTNLGSTDRVQGGFFTSYIDDESSGTKFKINPGLTSISILDYKLTEHINFEADIYFPEEAGIVQVETFGVSMTSSGTCFYGMQIEAVLDRIKDNISLDHLSRLLVDVQQDSSKIVDSVISAYQRSLLQLIFCGDAENRDKVNMIIANEITPHLTAEEYMDKGEYENELKQVLGDTRAAYDISEHDTLIFGSNGMLVAGPNSRHHEALLCSYLQFQSLDIFVRNFFNRLFLVVDSMSQLRIMIDTADHDPHSLKKIRHKKREVSEELIKLEEMAGYMDEALEVSEIPPEPPEQAGRSLYERLQIGDMEKQLKARVKDLIKNLEGSRHTLEILAQMSSIVSEEQQHELYKSMDNNTRNLCALQEASARASQSLEVMQVIMGGTLAFNILEIFIGEINITKSWWLQPFFENVVLDTPLVWLIINIALFVIVGLMLIVATRHLAWQNQGIITVRYRVDLKMSKAKLRAYLATKELMLEEMVQDGGKCIVRCQWTEPDKREWGGKSPTITIEYDDTYEWLFFVVIEYAARQAAKKYVFNGPELTNKLFRDLKKNGVIEELPILSGEPKDIDRKKSSKKKQKEE